MYDIPKTLETRLIAAGGLNRFGEPNFRVIWGQTRLTWIGGEFIKYDEHGNKIGSIIEERELPKYFPEDRYYLEKWMPPEHYGSPEAWAEYQIETVDGIRVPNLGPYPSRGEYELSMRFQTASGEFAQLSEDAAVELVRMIKAGEATSKTENWLAIQRHQEKEERDWNTHADAVLDDTNVFDGKPHIYVPNLTQKPKRLTPRELKAVRFIDMGVRPQAPPQGSVTL